MEENKSVEIQTTPPKIRKRNRLQTIEKKYKEIPLKELKSYLKEKGYSSVGRLPRYALIGLIEFEKRKEENRNEEEADSENLEGVSQLLEEESRKSIEEPKSKRRKKKEKEN